MNQLMVPRQRQWQKASRKDFDSMEKRFARLFLGMKPVEKSQVKCFLLVWNRILNGSHHNMVYVILTFIFSRYKEPLLFRPPLPQQRRNCKCIKDDYCTCECHQKKKEWFQLRNEWKESSSRTTPRPKFPVETNKCMCCLMCAACKRSLSMWRQDMHEWKIIKEGLELLP